jgi:hypothetical protein
MIERENKIDDLIDDLIYLRKGLGFVSSRIYRADTFMSIIGGKNQVFENIKIRFTSAIRSLPDKQNVEALLAAYGLLPGYEGTSLNERRAKYGKKVKRKYDTLVDREAAVIEELAIRLLNAYYSGAPLPAELPIPHGGYLLDYLFVETTIQDRQFIAHQQDRMLISLVNGAKGYEYHSSGRTRIIPIEGLTVETRYVKNGSIHRFLFPEPLIRGQTHKFSFQEILKESEEPEKLEEKVEDYAGQSFETPTLNFEQKVIFKGEKPAVIWSYDKLSRIERPGEQNAENILTVQDDDSVQKDFIQLYGGLHSGIAWRWNT